MISSASGDGFRADLRWVLRLNGVPLDGVDYRTEEEAVAAGVSMMGRLRSLTSFDVVARYVRIDIRVTGKVVSFQ